MMKQKSIKKWVTYHRQIQKTSGINRHGGEQRAHHVTHDGYASNIGAEHVVAVHVIWDDGGLCHVHVHVLEHVGTVWQV